MTEVQTQVHQTLSDYLSVQQSKVNSALNEYFRQNQLFPTERVVESAQYSLFLSAKRLRPLFCLEVCRALVGDELRAMPAAMALEMVHTYSLIHDDLPAMDNDDLRRGKPTNHKVYGDAMAILAGDGLLTLAFEALAKAGQASPSMRISWVRELAEASGLQGMVLGQAWDMVPVREASVSALEALHRKKTGALIASACAMGAIAADVDDGIVASIRQFGADLGLAFQIRDDVLDVVGGEDMGKPLHSDEKNQKPTYVSVLGLDKAKVHADEWAEKALRQVRALSFAHENRLEDLARYVIERKV